MTAKPLAKAAAYEDRYYQADYKAAFLDYFKGGGRAGLAVLPTASGKGPLSAWSAITATRNGRKAVIAIDSEELVEQNAIAVRRMAPGIDVGIYCAGLGCKMPRNDIVVCSIQSIWKKAELLGPRRMLVIDEVHMASFANEMYARFIASLLSMDEKMLICGMTASPYRSEQGHITDEWMKGDKKILPVVRDLFYEVGVKELMDAGYLAKMISKVKDTSVMTAAEKVKIYGGDLNQVELERAVNIDAVNLAVVAEAIRLGHDRNCWLTFGTGVSHAVDLAAMFRREGIDTLALHADTPKHERKKIITMHKTGKVRNVTNVATLVKGYDNTKIDFIVDAAVTFSLVRHIQKMGRGFRIDESKANTLVCDMGGNVRRFGPLDLIDKPIVKPKSGKKYPRNQNLMQDCDNCETQFSKQADYCPQCNHKAPPKQMSILDKLLKKADEDVVIVSDGTLESYVKPGEKLARVTGFQPPVVNPGKSGNPDTVRLVYHTTEGMISHFLSVGNGGSSRAHALRWWADHMPEGVPMSSMAELTCKVLKDNSRFIRMPDYIVIGRNENDLFWNAKRFLFEGQYEKPKRAVAAE